MKELEELTQEIREKLPRLTELTEGQRLLTLVSDEPNDIYEGAYETIGIGAYLLENGNIEIGSYEYEIGKAFEVVGKEPMLNDVLEWLQVKSQSDFEQGDKRYLTHFLAFKLSEWDLSTPYLKDQSPNLIKFLHGLIEKQHLPDIGKTIITKKSNFNQ